MPTGTIARLLIDKGFGFIRDEGGIEHFFHRSSVRGAVFELLREGQRVEFTPEDSGKGPSRRRCPSDRRLKPLSAAGPVLDRRRAAALTHPPQARSAHRSDRSDPPARRPRLLARSASRPKLPVATASDRAPPATRHRDVERRVADDDDIGGRDDRRAARRRSASWRSRTGRCDRRASSRERAAQEVAPEIEVLQLDTRARLRSCRSAAPATRRRRSEQCSSTARTPEGCPFAGRAGESRRRDGST